MNIRTVVSALSMVAALGASVASQASERQAMDACISAFTAQHLAKEQPVKVFKDYGTNSVLNVHDMLPYKIAVSARKANGERIAEGICSVDAQGVVTVQSVDLPSQKLATTALNK